MLAILKQWEEVSYTLTDNTEKYFFLFLFKFGLDTGVFYSCTKKGYTYILSLFSLSIVLADLLLTFLLATLWFLGAERYFVSPCFVLANASATYSSLPLPMMCLTLLDYCLGDDCLSKHTNSKLLRNVVLTLLVWLQAVIYAFRTVTAEPLELIHKTGIKEIVCEVEESTLITVSNMGLLAAAVLILLPFWSKIPPWVEEADRIYESREKQENKRSDLSFTSTWTYSMETKISKIKELEKNSWWRPPLWFSLVLCFTMFWVPYLVMFAGCIIYGFAVPAYISVNLLWLECINSFLIGVVFWVKSKTQGQYSNLPENVCMWQIYWHLSKGTYESLLPMATFNQSKEKRDKLLHM
ncbi:probable G-protein coupled receptor 160 [Melanotaenia boesemani]|uniref:probable G-protein coupled receptor 160 n=1 Tax=Melanotaenia boesemani TaxID=1250792 RepID=UPI001C051D11|nr:probable G-protein coupled receptor 160 [Melanotaenia boesemani]XP_041859602.1 probable G-protein coupled receptor 160 [Melanotaenia boesemani]